MEKFTGEISKILRDAGWNPGRCARAIECRFANCFGEKWWPKAARFVENFGGLEIAHKLWFWDKPDLQHSLTRNGERISEVAGSSVVPVATSNYLGDGCVIWIDAKGRFYAADSEGMVYLGINEQAALDVLLLGAKPSEPPAEIKAGLVAAYEWGENVGMGAACDN